MSETTSESLWHFSKITDVIYHRAAELYERLTYLLYEEDFHSELLEEIHALSSRANELWQSNELQEQRGRDYMWFSRAFVERDISAAPIMGRASFHAFAAETALWFIAELQYSDHVEGIPDGPYVFRVDGPTTIDPDGIEQCFEDCMAEFEEYTNISAELALEAAVAVKLFEAARSSPDRTLDKKTDSKKKSWLKTPSNPLVHRLAKSIRDNPDPDRTKTDIARELAGGDDTAAQSLLKAHRRWELKQAEQN